MYPFGLWCGHGSSGERLFLLFHYLNVNKLISFQSFAVVYPYDNIRWFPPRASPTMIVSVVVTRSYYNTGNYATTIEDRTTEDKQINYVWVTIILSAGFIGWL